MTKPFLLALLSLLLHLPALAQQPLVLDLYDGVPPNTRPSAGNPDTTMVLHYKGDSMQVHFVYVRPTLTVFLPPKGKATGMAAVICPGGGYGALSYSLEGVEMAKKFNEAGIAAFVLQYRLPNDKYQTNKEVVPLQDAQRALQLVRETAAKWNVNPRKVGIMGSSAGGHLAATAATKFQKAYIANPRNTNLRPDFIVLNYPVITLADNWAHLGSRMRLIGAPPTAAQTAEMKHNWQAEEAIAKIIPVAVNKIEEFSAERNVTAQTPPTFIEHALDDATVPVQNAILFIAALQKNRVPVESFFYSKGGHGYGIHNPTSGVQWTDACLKWLAALNANEDRLKSKTVPVRQ